MRPVAEEATTRAFFLTPNEQQLLPPLFTPGMIDEHFQVVLLYARPHGAGEVFQQEVDELIQMWAIVHVEISQCRVWCLFYFIIIIKKRVFVAVPGLSASVEQDAVQIEDK